MTHTGRGVAQHVDVTARVFAGRPTSLYFAHQNVFRSRDGGETW